MTAYQVVHMLEGRRPARHRDDPARSRPAAVRQDRHHRPARPTSGSSAARPRSSPASISASISRGRWAAMPRAARSRRRSSASSPATAFEGMPVLPFRAPQGIRMVAIDRRSGHRVFGAWPGDDPRAAVIWEAFKPESEPRRTAGREEIDPNAPPARSAATRPAHRPARQRLLAKRGRDLLGRAQRRPCPGEGRDPPEAWLQPPEDGHGDPMRAEAQASIDQIRSALDLLRRFLDWDRALKRLDELNAQVEDPTLWDDPKAAQVVMRERRRLDEAIGATRAIEKELADTVELMEMAEAEGDDGAGRRRRRVARRARRARREGQGRRPARRRGRRQRHLYRGQCRRRRHREPGLGRDAPAHVHALGRAPRLQGRAGRPSCRRAGRDQVGDAHDQGRERLWLCQDRERRPPAGPDQPLRQQRAAPHQLLERLGLSGGRREYRHRGQRGRSQDRHLPRVRRRRPAHQHHRLRRCGSPICRPASSSSARTSARSTRTAPRRYNQLARQALRGRAAEARGRGQCDRGGQDRHRLGPPDPLLRAAALSAGEGPAGPASPRPRRRTCSTAISTASWPPPCRSA